MKFLFPGWSWWEYLKVNTCAPEARNFFFYLFCCLVSLREFDIAAVVVFVGQLYTEAHQTKQWVFVADGSKAMLDSDDELETLMAINFTSPCIDSFAPINSNLVESTVSTD